MLKYNTDLSQMPYNKEVLVSYTFNKANNRLFYTIIRKFQNTYLLQDGSEIDQDSGFRIVGFMEVPKHCL